MKKEEDCQLYLTVKTLLETDDKNKPNYSDDKENIKLNENDSNFDIESLKSSNSLRSVFSIISKSDDDLDFNNSDSSNNSNINPEVDRKNSSLSRMSSISSNKPISFWDALKLKVNNIKNQIVFNYNIFSGSTNLKYNSPEMTKTIQIFNEKYTEQEKLINRLKNIPWLSYRKGFEPINQNDTIYTSDAGWGCMIRSSQMIFAQGLCKLYSINNLSDFINQFFAYFYENKIPIKIMCKNNGNLKKENKSQNIECNIEKENILDDFEVIDKNKEFAFSFINISSEMIKGLENMSERNIDKEYITPPYSIRNFIKVENHINKQGRKVGDWFSNYDCIRLIDIINKDMNKHKDCDFKVINFNEATIYIEEIIKNCFEEDKEDKQIKEVKENNNFEILSLTNIESPEKINNNLESKKYIFNDKKYIFKYKFIIFVSIRHGLYLLDDEMYDEVFKIFDIETNIGFIGGNTTRAFYFIGKCRKNLIYLDPHYIQETIPLKKLGTNSVQETYIPNDIYYMPINELSPSFTIGFAVKDMKSFKALMKQLTSSDYYIDQNQNKPNKMNHNPLFTVKNHKLIFKKK